MMNRKMKQRTLPGVPYAEERSYESRNRQIARGAAAEGMVLLKNDKVLVNKWVDKTKRVALERKF